MNPLETAISTVGGVGKLAEAIGIGQSAVSNWRARGTTPDAAYCVAIERATSGAVSRRDLRPDDWHLIWPELAASVQEVGHG
ncbi:helix-turn-helix domain-containing protein [Paracidovorax citrulli]|uniref:transcriptional regulator n=1 Tax=Paracidovorax citrulli TaxID=80869 RepID=UPI0005FB7499|nr:helix-turn-helix domain-containing protein [Paracidovorax citrulli]UMT88361.1 helix-turn-helix domain-containing protein [Paracidovorax citrulli]WIY32730.1 helix-turn-helix domain-containing protein [Paracidovorax citrulli]SDJ31784.1 Putative antitoxin of toxin-antitoxin system, YdaS/YdaT [Paracidovorax citrulli]